jgi:uncharacterized NAD(P)/FAD-binding protein YdhS
MNPVRPDEPVVILGSGLTAVDAVLSLTELSHQASITLLSRNGLLPQAHAAGPVAPAHLEGLVAGLLAAPGGVRALALFRGLRKKVRELAAQGGDWRSVVDGLRPHTASLWQAMPPAERRRFLSRLRPFWEVHRHRMALPIARRFHDLLERRQLQLVAGRVEAAQAEEDGVRLLVRERGTDRLLDLPAAWVINCTGPMPSNRPESNPVVGSLLVDGWLRLDDLALGIETTPEGNALDAGAREVPDLFVVGTLRKPALWETTAVPELRAQAAMVGERAVEHVFGQPQSRGAEPERQSLGDFAAT